MRKIFSNPKIAGNGILWVVGLAMQIGGWVNQVIAITLLAFAFLWSTVLLIFWLKNRKKRRDQQTGLKIGVRVKKVSRPADIYSQAQSGIAIKSQEVIVDIILSPLKNMTIDYIELELWGNKYKADTIPMKFIDGPESFPASFRIPKEFTLDTQARICIFANNSNWFSEPFDINFGTN